MSKNRSLSLRTQWLGERLRAAREAAGLTLVEAGKQLHLTDTSLSRFEKGMVRIRRPYVKEMIDFYGVSDHRQRNALLTLNEDSWRKDWWDGDSSDLETGFIDYTWLEARATKIQAFSPLLIPGLLQTPDYAHALTVAGLGTEMSENTIQRMVALRSQRQQIFDRTQPTQLEVIIEEAPLRRTIGAPTIHAGQLHHLLDQGKTAYINIRVLPHRGWHPGLDGPFSYFDLPDPYPHVVYIENLVGRTFLEEKSKVDRYRQAYDRLRDQALTPNESAGFISKILQEIE